ncbi:MAG: beta-galactosidase [Defluviitaleaceae bacterium]|nr:beta-galactosidase [Defluviitaleaceae bacterium]
MTNTAIRPEHPRPQMKRGENDWINLNGIWDFEFDFSRSGLDRKFYETGVYTKQITVPFCPESILSGIGFTDFIPACWYRRTVDIPSHRLSGTVLLHFGAVDYFCAVYINGKRAGSHKGGYSSFNFDITSYLTPGENTIVVYVEDDVRGGKQPRGKQCPDFNSRGCDYTRTTGIWQTVWLEFTPKQRIVSYKAVPDVNNCAVDITLKLAGDTNGMAVNASASFNGSGMGSVEAIVNGNTAALRLNLKESHIWDAGVPNLYDLSLELKNAGEAIDNVNGYFGLRSVYIKDGSIYLNNRPLFQRLVLDQGFYPDGIYTAPTDEALKRDIEISMALGFNGARLHEKVFEERFLYHADRLGYLVWGEHANWGLDITVPDGLHNFLPEWLEVMERDFNHPSIIGWCPFNETWDMDGRKQYDDTLRVVYLATKAADPTRPVIDTSGNFHVITDIYDMHDYDQNVESFEKKYKYLKKGEIHEMYPHRQKHEEQPFFVSEYGGAWWSNEAKDKNASWGYGDRPTSVEEFLARYTGLTDALLSSEGICAFCYTQLYDIEQEENGLYTYDRKPKFPQDVYDAIRTVNTKKAAIE